MNDLITIKDNAGQPGVDARELHEFLQSKRQFADWIKSRIEKYGFDENHDYVLISQNCETRSGGTVRKEYTLSLDMAKELAMVENNEQGRKARRYFIEVEKRYRAQLPQTFAEALQLAADQARQIEKQTAELEQSRQAVQFYSDVTGSKDAISMSEAAKVIGFAGGRNKLFSFLRDNGVLRHNNEPYQSYIDRGWFRVVEQKFSKPDGSISINIKTLVYQRGLDGIIKLLRSGI